MLIKRTMDEMITYFNDVVSAMDISRKDKITLLGMITAIGFEYQQAANAIEKVSKPNQTGGDGMSICGECKNTLPARDGFPNQVFCTIHHWHNGEREDASRCSYFKKKPKTNADRVKAMTDEELAEFIWGVETDGRAYGCRGKAAWLKWLKQEATDEV